MFASTITLANVAATNHDFVQIDSPAGQGITRLDAASTLANPVTMNIRHAVFGKGALVTDKHTVSFFATATDPTSGQKTVGKCTVSFEVPRSGAVVAATVQDLWAYTRNFLPSAAPAANFNALLIGQS
jgi:hypothetical protein